MVPPDLATQTAVEINSGKLRLEGLLDIPDSGDSKCPGIVLCHPHPRYGGAMHNSVVTGVAGELTERGFGVLRFNFRGVGSSEGKFDWGAGECEDAKAAVDHVSLVEEIDSSRIGIVGYSFGAAVAIQAAMDSATIQAVASIACPAAQLRALSGLEIIQPKLLLLGGNDHDFPIGQFRFLSKRFSDPCEYAVIPKGDHFFRGLETKVGGVVGGFFERWLRR